MTRTPARSTKVELRIAGDARHRADLETDEDGRFLAMAGRIDQKNRATAIVFWVQPEGERPLVARAAPRELRAGRESLGDLVLELDALVVAGRCEIGGEPGKLPFGSGVQRRVVREGREPRWTRLRDLRTFALDDGTFELRGDCPDEKLRLVVGAKGTSEFEPVEFRRGQADLLVELAKGADLAATLLLPEDTPQQVKALLNRAEGNRDPITASLLSREDGRTQANWRNLAPGSYDLTLSIDGIPEPLHRVSDVVIPQPPGGDSRLVDIDLRELVMIQEVRLSMPGDENHWRFRGGRLFPLGQPPDEDLRGHMVWGTETRLLLPRGTVPMLVSVDGCRTQEIVCRGEPITVVLDPLPKASILVRTGLDLPKGHSLRVSLARPAAASNRKWRAQWGSGDVADLYGPPRVPATVKNGKAELQVGDELLMVELNLRYRRETVSVEIPQVRANVTTPIVHIDVGDDALRRAIEQLEKR